MTEMCELRGASDQGPPCYEIAHVVFRGVPACLDCAIPLGWEPEYVFWK